MADYLDRLCQVIAATTLDDIDGATIDHAGLVIADTLACICAGSSYGALIAALMYFDRPDRVDKLVLVGSASVFEPPEAAREALAAARENASSAMGDPSIESCRRRLANASHRKGAAVDDIVLAQLTSYALPHLLTLLPAICSEPPRSYRLRRGTRR